MTTHRWHRYPPTFCSPSSFHTAGDWRRVRVDSYHDRLVHVAPTDADGRIGRLSIANHHIVLRISHRLRQVTCGRAVSSANSQTFEKVGPPFGHAHPTIGTLITMRDAKSDGLKIVFRHDLPRRKSPTFLLAIMNPMGSAVCRFGLSCSIKGLSKKSNTSSAMSDYSSLLETSVDLGNSPLYTLPTWFKFANIACHASR